ncbi:MAG TPA: CocE/NonD family hydrolase [Trebonia sp.]|nr:CocE/NonD family hydrolase [Trebonia sp.]
MPVSIARALSAVSARIWQLPAARNPVAVTPDIAVPAADGVTMLADHYAPVFPGRPGSAGGPGSAGDTVSPGAPTVLVRTPYGRGLQGALNAQFLAERGYHVLLVSCRGTFGSGGEFDPGRDEAADGQACVEWLRGQDWFDGRLATFGLSYLGFTQWALATDPPPELRASVVMAGLHDFAESVHHDGAFALHTTLAWADMIAHQELPGARGLAAMVTADRRVRQAMDRNPIAAGARSMLGAREPWFERWMSHTDIDDAYWGPLRCGTATEKLQSPVLLIGGWQDIFLRQTLQQYQALSGRGVSARLIVGPWTHVQIATRGGGIALRETLGWLDRYTAGDQPGPSGGPGPTDVTGPSGPGPVRLYIGGGGGWRDFAAWPPPESAGQRWALRADGRLSPDQAGPDQAGPEQARSDQIEGAIAEVPFRYDPALPTPAVGGPFLARGAGVTDNRALERRPDVIVFTSAPLRENLDIAGEVTAEISLVRDNPHADVFVRLCDVDGRGRSLNVSDGITRLSGGDPLEGVTRVRLYGTAHRFAAGHRVRLQVSGGAHPRFARNPGTGAIDAAAAELRDTRYRVRTGASAVILPVLR